MLFRLQSFCCDDVVQASDHEVREEKITGVLELTTEYTDARTIASRSFVAVWVGIASWVCRAC